MTPVKMGQQNEITAVSVRVTPFMTLSYSVPLRAERSITDPSSLHSLPPAI